MSNQYLMQNSYFYRVDDELREQHINAKKLFTKYNSLLPTKKKAKKIIKDLVSSIGENFYIENGFKCDYGFNITIGENFYANYNLVILDSCQVCIGDNVLFGPNVQILTATHPIDPKIRIKGYEYAQPVTIEDNVWLGAGVIVNPGVTIGKGSVIGSGSVVTSDIPPGVVAVGNPCIVLYEISDEHHIQAKNKVREAETLLSISE
ncbi:MAG: sugar O-acetyltransferase [Ruminobacter sp.]|nr:sugar O-acetyltransferase [Ruminobacter sp.]